MDSGFSIRSIFVYLFFALLSVLTILVQNLSATGSIVVFCDVGQGDGAYIRLANHFDIVVDAGPDQRILDCLGKYMPFYDREIELALLSHPQRDHYGGFLDILERYKVDNFLLSPLDNEAKSYQALKKLFVTKKVHLGTLLVGEEIKLENGSIRPVWPTNQFIEQNVISSKNYHGFYQTTTDLNNFSQVFLLTIGTTKILFTGDISPVSEQKILKGPLPAITILKVPHHGSKNGLIEPFLQALRPQIAVISVGKNNSFDHPSPEIIKMLEKYKVQIRRTDQEGDIVFKF
jgi:competence protein ComEC